MATRKNTATSSAPDLEVRLDPAVQEQISETVTNLAAIMRRLGVLKLAIDGMWFADTNMGKGRRAITGNDFDNLSAELKYLSGDLLVAINDLQTLPGYVEEVRHG